MRLSRSRFTENFARLNGLFLTRWVFDPGMLYLAGEKWWGDKGLRGQRHNGLDLHTYIADDGRAWGVKEGMNVPIAFDGTIVKTIGDFLGRTFFAAHDIYVNGSQLFTIYGHLQPSDHFCEGKYLREGTVFSRISGTGSSRVPAHIHLSVAFIPKTIRRDSLSWEFLDGYDKTLFLDPGSII